mmetsp:Transcript_29189/g.68392  ORF Transcript_29189/g.68392 Transcript_29189/m.68392 type:complete len:213 (+) Transcript_29189:217-855(+)
MRALAHRINQTPVGSVTPVAYLSQLVQLDNALRLDAPALLLRLDPSLVEACVSVIREEQLTRVKPSNLHLHVSDALRHMKIEHQNEFVVPGLSYSVDIALRAPRLLIEVNGTEVHARAHGAPGGAQLMKYRHLCASGWRVLVVTEEEWRALGSSLEAQCGFLAEHISQCGRLPVILGLDAEAERGAASVPLASPSGEPAERGAASEVRASDR